MARILETTDQAPIKPTHEEALKFFANYLHAMKQQQPNSQRTLVFERIMADIKKMHHFLQLLAEVDNREGTKRLAETGLYDKFRDPRVVDLTRTFVQEL